MPAKTILTLGGSYVGMNTAHYILKHIIPSPPSPETYQVVLVSPSDHIIVRPATPRAFLGDEYFDQDKLFVSLPEQFKQYSGEDFKFIHGLAKHLNHNNRVITVAECEIGYHALIIGTGSSTPSPLLSLNSGSSTDLKATWTSFRDALPAAKAIATCRGRTIQITVVTSRPEILPVLRLAIARSAEGLLRDIGVKVVKGVKVESVSPVDESEAKDELTGKTVVRLSNGETLHADLYIPAYGTRPNTAFVDDELKGHDGRVKTNPQTLRVEGAGDRVYALGDASDYARPAVHILMEAIPVLCTNLKRDVLEHAGESVPGEDRVFKADESETHLVPNGRNKGVGAVKGWRMPSFFVWLIKGRDYWLGMTDWSGKQWAKEK
ncbi:uncharacterized protein BDV17DRAFT_283099 [Aspergillus undulatus]|uniref:uncharacterized protein n=1 Tax=Aspergillus undulatus TaxID=1810928 RepID=UPI003CCE495F